MHTTLLIEIAVALLAVFALYSVIKTSKESKALKDEIIRYQEQLSEAVSRLNEVQSSLDNYKRVTAELKLRGDLYKKGVMDIISYATGKKLIGSTKKIASFAYAARAARDQVKLQVKG